ncbi:MAG: SpvB/TcaC N-terminal domain-containing protein [Pseudomonadota bacterium]
MQQQTTVNQSQVAVSPLSLPQGGGALRSMHETLGPIGPDGSASLSLPLPISPGRGYAPSLALQYASTAGNGVFGLGWQVPIPQIMRRTRRGVPTYTDQDEMIGPQGEVLVPERDAQGQIVTRSCARYGDLDLSATYSVTRYLPRVEGSFDRIESWAPQNDPDNLFWLIHGADGQLHCLGKSDLARTSVTDASGKRCIAAWSLEESVSPTGEHMVYRYQAEDAAGVDLSGVEADRSRGALSHLVEVCYGNRVPAADLYAWQNTTDVDWFFHLVFDYGERGLDDAVAPAYAPTGDWLARPDPFSGYAYGFETRCHRLCHQVLMFHAFAELGESPTLVQRLLFDYALSPVLSQLINARLWAYGADGSVQSLPPVAFDYSQFALPAADQWRTWSGSPGLDNGRPYQIVDLYGEGIPGLLYRGEDNGWLYRAAQRDTEATTPDAVSYQDWQPLPATPSLAQPSLLDVDGSGQLDWVITQPGLAGCFTLQQNGSWSRFTPFTALPNEFFHPQAQLADVLGAGLSDLVLIGPQSVRLYANQRTGFAAAQGCAQDVILPVPGQDPTALVAFADLLGSGQQHLVKIRHDSVYCWPNLGHGCFGQPLHLAALDLDAATFAPDRVYLADLDGSGAVDLIYATADHLLLYANQSGNGFAEPISLPLPEGVRFDQLCQLIVADVQGLGTASLILSVPYPQTRHWRYDVGPAKPYLLTGINNNSGSDTSLSYRSSAQYWLDDKAADASATTQLPYPIHTVASTCQQDEISGTLLTRTYAYHRGMYDPVQREFRGFALVEQQDTSEGAVGNQTDTFTPPVLQKTWYHTGQIADEVNLVGGLWQGDAQMYAVSPTRLTRWDSAAQEDQVWDDPDRASQYWLYRALGGHVLRQETYGLDESTQQTTPYQVSLYRYQVRQYQAAQGDQVLVAVPLPLEQLSYTYERIATDPQCQQQVLLAANEYAQPTWQVTIQYPRRPARDHTAYPADLPATTLTSSYDAQQQVLRVQQSRQSYYQLTDPAAWQLRLADTSRQDSLLFAATEVPAGGFHLEQLISDTGLLAQTPQEQRCAGQSRCVYREQPPHSLPVLVDHTEVVQLDEVALATYADINPEVLANQLTAAGYQLVDQAFAAAGTAQVWAVAQGFTTYDDDHFYRPVTRQATQLTGAMQLDYNTYGWPEKTTDALGNVEQVLAWDYARLQPTQMQDANGTVQAVALDLFGQVVASWLYGTEYGQTGTVGFSDPQAEDCIPTTVTDLLQQAQSDAVLTVAERYAVDPFSWMAMVSEAQLSQIAAADQAALLQAGVLIRDPAQQAACRLTARGRRWVEGLLQIPDLTRISAASLAETPGPIPPHALHVQADRYPDAGYYPDQQAQQCQVTIAYRDGSGRALQTLTLDRPGLAYQLDASGGLVLDETDQPVQADSDPRWAASGRVEYDNKGQMVRAFQPYFINDWAYVAAASLQAQGYADRHYYDPLGREVQVDTANGYQRRIRRYPWFVVTEDENDTEAAT